MGDETENVDPIVLIEALCPMCGDQLAMDVSYLRPRIVCDNPLCEDADAVHKLLNDPEREHIVRIEDERFHLKHPLRERVNDRMLDCSVHTDLSYMHGAPAAPGVYRVTRVDGDLVFDQVMNQ